MAIDHSTVKLHATLIRLAKGMLDAWEKWVNANTPPPKVEIEPDPVEHFRRHNQK